MKIVTYSNVFLTRSGIGLKRFMLVDETIHQYKGKRTHFLYYALYQFFFKKKLKLKGQYFIIHNHWCPGYYHWITEALPRLLSVHTQLSNHVLLLPESFRGAPFDSIDPLYKGQIIWIPQHKNLIIDTLLIPENPPLSGVYDRKAFHRLRELYRKAVSARNISLNLGKKIYVSRSKASRRRVVNEFEVIEFLRAQGFVVVNFEDYSFWHQVAIMQQTEVVVSIHGAGLSNVLFMEESSVVIELQKEAINLAEQSDVLYKDFSEMLDLRYHVLLCEPVDRSQSLYVSDIIVNLDRLNDLLPF